MASSLGSGLFSKAKAALSHLVKPGGGLSGEVHDVRKDVLDMVSPLAALAVEEFTNPATGGAADLLAATASSVAVQTYLTADLLAPGLAKLAAFPRNITFTTAGVTPADAPATATITGTYLGVAQTEVVNIAQTATIATGTKPFSTITSIVYSAGQGTAATVSIGVGAGLGVAKTPKSRAGAILIFREIAVGAVVTNGVLTSTGLYTPNSAPDGTRDYCVYYEFDAAA
jgi:hypothetical protein